MKGRILLCFFLGSGLACGDLPEEAEKYLTALRGRPESVGLFDRFADAWKEERNGSELLAFLNEEAERTGKAEDWAILARAEESAGKDEQALSHFGKALEAMPDAAWMRMARARLMWRKRQYAEAAGEALMVPVGHELRNEAAGLAGRAMIRAQRQDEAIGLWLKEVERSPDDTDLLEDLVELCRREGRAQEALDFSDKLLKAEKDALKREQARLERMNLLLAQGQTEEAMKAALQVLESSGVGSWLEREVLERAEEGLKKRGGSDAWKKTSGEWATKFPARLELSRRHAEALSDAGEWDAALGVVKEWLRRSPGDADGLRLRVRLLEGAERKGAAWKALEDLADRFPEDEGLFKEQVEMAYRFERKDDLRASLQRWTDAAKDDAARVRMGEAWARYGFREEAEELWMGLIDGDAGPLADRALAAFFRQEKRLDEEKEAWLRLGRRGDAASREAAANGLISARAGEEALALFDGVPVESASDAALLTRIARAAGKHERAYQHARAWLGLSERVPEIEQAVVALIDLAVVLEERAALTQELEEKEELEFVERCLLAELLVKESPERVAGILEVGGDPAHEYHVGLLTRVGRWAEAAEKFESVKPGHGREASYYRRLGDLQRGAGKGFEAAEAYRKWREVAPNNADAWKAEAGIWTRNDPNRAERLLRRALARFEEPSGLDEMLLSLLTQRSRFRDAYDLAWKSYLREQGNPRWTRDLINIAKRAQRVGELGEELTKLAEDQANSPLPLLALADLVAVGSWRDSGRSQADYLIEALRRAPSEKVVWVKLARHQESLGRSEEAIRAWEELARRWPGPQTARDLADARLRNGDIERGLRDWAELANGKRVDIRRCEEAALGVAQAGHLSDAVAFLRSLGEANDPMSLWVTANLLGWDGREDEEAEILLGLVQEHGGKLGRVRVNQFHLPGLDAGATKLVAKVASMGRSSEIALSDPVRNGVDRLLQAPLTDEQIADAAAERLFRLGVSIGGELWEMAEAAESELAIAPREDWLRLMASSRQSGGLISLWRAHPERDLFHLAMFAVGQLNNLTGEERKAWMEGRDGEFPLEQEFHLRNNYFTADGPEWMVGWLEKLEPGVLDVVHVVMALRRQNWANDIDFAERCDRLLDRLVVGDERESLEFLGLRSNLALAMDDRPLAIPRIRVFLEKWEEARDDDKPVRWGFPPNAYRYSPHGSWWGHQHVDGLTLVPFLQSTRGLVGIGQYAHLSFDLNESPELAAAIDSPVIRCQMMLSHQGFDEYLEEERADLGGEVGDAVRSDLKVLEWYHRRQLGKAESLEDQIDEELQEDPKSRLAAFGIAIRLEAHARQGMKEREEIEAILRDAEKRGVDIGEKVFKSVLMGVVSHWSSQWQARLHGGTNSGVPFPDPEFPLLCEVIGETFDSFVSGQQGGYGRFGMNAHFAQGPPPVRRSPLRLLRSPLIDTRVFSGHLKEGRVDEAIQMLAGRYPSMIVGDWNTRNPIEQLKKAEVDLAKLLAGVARPSPEEGLAACRKWIQFADLCGQAEPALRMTREIAEARPWDLAWRLEWLVRGCGLDGVELPDLDEMTEAPGHLASMMGNRVNSSLSGETMSRLADVLTDGISANRREPWLTPLLGAMVGRIKNAKEEEPRLEDAIWVVADRVAVEDPQFDPLFAEMESSKLAATSERMTRLARLSLLAALKSKDPNAWQRMQRLGGRSQLWLIKQLNESPVEMVFPVDYLADVQRQDEPFGSWLKRLINAEDCRGLPAPLLINQQWRGAVSGDGVSGPFEFDQRSLGEFLTVPEGEELILWRQLQNRVQGNQFGLVMARAEQLPGKRYLFDLLARYRGHGVDSQDPSVRFEAAALLEVMSSGELEGWIVSSLEEIETRETARVEVAVKNSQAPPQLGRMSSQWISKLIRNLTNEPEAWARVVRLAVAERLLLGSISNYPQMADDWLKQMGLLGDLEEVAGIGVWVNPGVPDYKVPEQSPEVQAAENPPIYVWKGKEVMMRRWSSWDNEKRKLRNAEIGGKSEKTFGESLFLSLGVHEGDKKKYVWLGAYDDAFAELDPAMATAILGDLVRDQSASFYDGLGTHVREILAERDRSLYEDAGLAMAKVIEWIEEGETEELQKAARLLSSTTHRARNPEAWLKAVEALAEADSLAQQTIRSHSSSILNRASVGLNAGQIRRLFAVIEKLPASFINQSSNTLASSFWQDVLSGEDVGRAEFRAIARVVDEHSPDSLRELLWTHWFRSSSNTSWTDPHGSDTRPGDVDWLEDLGGCMKGWSQIEDEEAAKVSRAVCIARSMKHLFPPDERSSTAMTQMIKLLRSGPCPPEVIGLLCQRRVAMQVANSQTDRYLVGLLEKEKIEEPLIGGIHELVGQLVHDYRVRSKDVYLKSLILKLAMKLDDPELVASMMDADTMSSSEWSQSFAVLLKQGDIERIEKVMGRLPYSAWSLIRLSKHRHHEFIETRGVLDLDDLEQRWLALVIDQLSDKEETGSTLKERREWWWKQLNESPPKDLQIAQLFASRVLRSDMWLLEPSPLIEACFDFESEDWLSEVGELNHASRNLPLGRLELIVTAACSRALSGDFSALKALGLSLEGYYEAPEGEEKPQARQRRPGIRFVRVVLPFWMEANKRGADLPADIREAARIWSGVLASEAKSQGPVGPSGVNNFEVITGKFAESLQMLASDDWSASEGLRSLSLEELCLVYQRGALRGVRALRYRDVVGLRGVALALCRLQLAVAKTDGSKDAVEAHWDRVLVDRDRNYFPYPPFFLLRDDALFESVPDALLTTMIVESGGRFAKECLEVDDLPWLRKWVERNPQDLVESSGISKLIGELEGSGD